jgi:cytochrome c oxidase subunit 3/cytochrome o ubiquinol oxidase subunit 3
VSETAVSPGVLATFPAPPPIPQERRLSTYQVGMIAFLFSEVAFFSTLIVTYVIFLGKDVIFLGKDASGPTPAILSLRLVVCTTICLLASSGTIHMAERSLHAGSRSGFFLWWSATIALGVLFLLGTTYEWTTLITRDGLTIGRNLFGTTYYTLVGFHALHVTAGVVIMSIILGLTARRQITGNRSAAVQLASWYWHFVDGVWVVVFAVVYLIGR